MKKMLGNANKASPVEADVEGDTDEGTSGSDGADPLGSAEVAGRRGDRVPAAPARKMAQQLEVLELELRARAIRSLMKQYGKDVG